MSWQDNIRIVLVNPSHPGNIGASARAMKNMGLQHLYLVEPESFPDQRASARAAGADDVLASAYQAASLTEALHGCQRIYATSARNRTLSWPQSTPRQAAQQIGQYAEQKVAIVFGREQSGLTNQELAQCHFHIHIPTVAHFSSLNLAAAVQVIAYEIYLACDELAPQAIHHSTRAVVSAQKMQGFYRHLQATLTNIDFLDPKQPRMLMQRLQRLFYRAEIDNKELNILRGILSAIDRVVTNNQGNHGEER